MPFLPLRYDVYSHPWVLRSSGMMTKPHRISGSMAFPSPRLRLFLPIHCPERFRTPYILMRKEGLLFWGSRACKHTLIVVHTYRGEVVRIISARAATSRERKIMNEEKNKEVEMLDEYDFSQAVIGKYAKQYAEGTNIVILDPDVAKVFPDSAAVNEALRQIIEQRSR